MTIVLNGDAIFLLVLRSSDHIKMLIHFIIHGIE